MAYCGNDVFVTCNFNTGVYKFYNIKEDIYFEFDDISGINPVSPNILFENGYSIVCMGGSYVWVSVTGEVIECIGKELVSNTVIGNIQDGVLVYGLTENGGLGSYGRQMKNLLFYDIEKDISVAILDTPMEQYIDNVYESFIPKENLCFSDDRIVIPMLGADFELYIAIFDKQWNEVLEPTKITYSENMDNYRYNSDRLVINFGDGDIVMDENGQILFSANDIGFDNISDYSDDVAQVGNGKYIDKMGNLLFEEIH